MLSFHLLSLIYHIFSKITTSKLNNRKNFNQKFIKKGIELFFYHFNASFQTIFYFRSEERRVGKECP